MVVRQWPTLFIALVTGAYPAGVVPAGYAPAAQAVAESTSCPTAEINGVLGHGSQQRGRTVPASQRPHDVPS